MDLSLYRIIILLLQQLLPSSTNLLITVTRASLVSLSLLIPGLHHLPVNNTPHINDFGKVIGFNSITVDFDIIDQDGQRYVIPMLATDHFIIKIQSDSSRQTLCHNQGVTKASQLTF